LIRLSLIINAFALALVFATVPLALHANSLIRTSRERAAVYFLYDEGAGIPRWLFGLGMYRVSRQAEQIWGAGCTVVDRLNKATLRTALANGRVVILATHGEGGYAATYYAPECLCIGAAESGTEDEGKSARFLSMSVRDRENRWGKWENVPVGRDLRLAYIFACNAGERAPLWNERLAPAQVITYNRVSTVFDHAYWFAVTGPRTIKGLR